MAHIDEVADTTRRREGIHTLMTDRVARATLVDGAGQFAGERSERRLVDGAHDGAVTELAYGPPPPGGFYAYRPIVVPATLDVLRGPLEGWCGSRP